MRFPFRKIFNRQNNVPGYAEGQPKRRKRRRFHFFDYLWWTGEELGHFGRVDGELAIWMFAVMPLIVPMIVVAGELSLPNSVLLVLLIICFLSIFLVHTLFTKERRKAVMRHYSKRKFRRFPSVMVCISPFLIICVMTFASGYSLSKRGQEKNQSGNVVCDKALMQYIRHERMQSDRQSAERLLRGHRDVKRFGIIPPSGLKAIDSCRYDAETDF